MLLFAFWSCSVPSPPSSAVDPRLGSEVILAPHKPNVVIDAAQCHSESQPDRPCRLIRRMPASAGVVECWCWVLVSEEQAEGPDELE